MSLIFRFRRVIALSFMLVIFSLLVQARAIALPRDYTRETFEELQYLIHETKKKISLKINKYLIYIVASGSYLVNIPCMTEFSTRGIYRVKK